MVDRSRYEIFSYLGIVSVLVLGLYLCSRYSYLLFHSLIEISTIAIGFTLFILAWNARRFLANDCLKLLGIGYACIACIDLLHCLAYKGMHVFPGYDANLPTQLWIAARYLQAITLCVAPLFFRRRVSEYLMLAVYAAAVSALVVLVFSGTFPDCFVDGKGLTRFKILSEYTITGILLVALYRFHCLRAGFDVRIYRLIVWSIWCTVFAELSFTAYLSVYGFANMLGHLLKLAAFYLTYRALLVTGFREPYLLIFRDLTQAQDALTRAHETLEETVCQRTTECRASEEKYRSLIQMIQAAVVVHAADGRIVTSNILAERLLGQGAAGVLGKAAGDPDWHFCREDGSVLPKDAYPVNRVLTTGEPLRDEVFGILSPGGGETVWVLLGADPVRDDVGRIVQVIVTFVDISEKKRVEVSLQHLNRELRAISNCNQALMRAADEQSLLHDICRIVCVEAGYRMAWVGFAENDATKSVRVAAWAGVEDGYLAGARLTWADTERGRGPTGMAIRTGGSVCIQDFASDPRAVPWRKGALQRGYRSSIALPLKDEGACTFGVLNIYSGQPGAFTADEVWLLEELAGDLAFGVMVIRARVERREAEEALRRLNLELEQRVGERTAELEAKNIELERMNKLFVGRELRMVELKERIAELESRAPVARHEPEPMTAD